MQTEHESSNNNNNEKGKGKVNSLVVPACVTATADTRVYEDRVTVLILSDEDRLTVKDAMVGNKADITFRMLMQTKDVCSRIAEYRNLETITDLTERHEKGVGLNVINIKMINNIIKSCISIVATALMMVKYLRTAYQKAKIAAMIAANGKFMPRSHYIIMGELKLAYTELVAMLYGAFEIEDMKDWDKALKLPAFYEYLEQESRGGDMKYRPDITANNIDHDRIVLLFSSLIPLVMTGNFVLILLSHMAEYDDDKHTVDVAAQNYISAHYPLIRAAPPADTKDDDKDEVQPGRYEKYIFNHGSNITMPFARARENFGVMIHKLPEDKFPQTHEQLKLMAIEYSQLCTNQTVTCDKNIISTKKKYEKK
jgi:hypothetical protein